MGTNRKRLQNSKITSIRIKCCAFGTNNLTLGPPVLPLSVPFPEKVKLLYLSHSILTIFHSQMLLVLSKWK